MLISILRTVIFDSKKRVGNEFAHKNIIFAAKKLTKKQYYYGKQL